MLLFFLLIAFFNPAMADSSCPFRPLNSRKTAYRMCIPSKTGGFELGDEILIAGVHRKDRPYSVNFNLLSETYQFPYRAAIIRNCKEISFNSHQVPGAKGEWPKTNLTHYIDPEIFEGNVWHRIKNTEEGITFEINFWEWEEVLCTDRNYLKKYTYKHRVENPATDYKYFQIEKQTTLEFGVIIYRSADPNIPDKLIPFKEELWAESV